MKKVILIGDSIRMGYQQTVREQLASLAEVGWPEMNGFDSRNVLARLDEWARLQQADVVHINAGLHDIKRDRQAGTYQVPLEEYARNVEQILGRLRDGSPAKVIWATITPVNHTWHRARKPFDRYEADVAAYNAKALEICCSLGIAVNDLCAVMAAAGPDSYICPDGVHFTEAGYELLGREVAKVIRANL